MKKKITMLFAALLACVGVSAQTVITDVSQLSNDKVYSIVPKDATRGAMYATSTSLYLDACGGTANYAKNPSVAIDANSADQQFALYTHEGSMYLFSVGAGKFVSEVTEDLFPLVEQPGNAVAVEASGEEGYFIIKAKGTEFINVSTGWAAGCVAGWNQIDNGNKLQITEVSEMPAATLAQLTTAFSKQVELTYVYTYGETEWRRETVSATKGEAYPAAAAVFGGTCTVPEGVVADDVVAGTEVEIVCTLDEGVLPFQFAADYASIEHWYYMNIHADGYYLGYEEGQTSISLTETSVPVDAKDAYTWAFIGNPFNGFQIVNKLAGEGKILSSTTNTFDGNTGGNTYPLMTETPVADGNNTYWIPSSSTHRTNGFYLAQKDANGGKNIMNYRDGKLAYWNNGANEGSTFVVEERPMGPVAELAALIEEIEAAGIVCGTNPGEYTEASVNDLNEAVARAKTVGSSATESDLNDLQTAYNALDVNPITAGKYIIVNAKPAFDGGKVLTAYAKCTYNGTHNTPAWTDKNLNDPLQYWTVEVDGDNCYLKAAYEGSYVTSVKELGDEPKAATFTWLAPGQYNISVGDGVFHANLHNWANTSSSNIIGFAGGADSPSAWKLVTVSEEPEFTLDLAVGEVGYATLMLAYNATIPTGATCYTAAVDGEYVKLTEVEGNVLPAKTPVIVAAEADTYSFVSTTATAAVSAENELVGSLYPQIVTPDANTTCYVLAKPAAEEGEEENPVGFYKAALNQSSNTAFLNNANKVYLPVAAGAAAPAMFSFERGEGTTGIETAVNGEQTAVIYDLAGRRVEKMEKGIYIVNGKKVIK